MKVINLNKKRFFLSKRK